MKKAAIIIFLVLLVDQILKVWIKTNMYLGEEITVAGDWFILHFTENNGMAFGLEYAGKAGKIALSLFRILAVVGIGYLIWRSVTKKEHQLLVVCWALIFAGAMGNIIDGSFYGLIFGESGYFPNQVAQAFPEQGGYAGLLFGKVVDMFYFPLVDITANDATWLPNFIFGNDGHFVFFRPVFNVADSAITVGVVLLLIYHFKYEQRSKKEEVRD